MMESALSDNDGILHVFSLTKLLPLSIDFINALKGVKRSKELKAIKIATC